MKKKSGSVTIGSITDGHRKLEIQIPIFKDHDFKRGQRIEVAGLLQHRGDSSPYLMVMTMDKIKVLAGDIPSLLFLMKGDKYV